MNMVKRNSEIKPFYSNFLDDFLNTGLSAFEDRRGVTALNVKEDEKELALELRVPGMKKEDIHLDYKDGILTISGEKNEEKEEKDRDKTDDDYSGITFPGGHVERGESFTDAVIREVWEETGLKISEPKLCGIKDWMKDEETRYIVLLYKTDKFEGIVTSSEEWDVFWLTLDEMKQRKLAYGMDKMLEVFLNDNISEYFFFEENGKWIEELK